MMPIMDIDKIMMFLIMYDMCNHNEAKTQQESQSKKKNVINYNNVKHFNTPKETKFKRLQALKTNKRRL